MTTPSPRRNTRLSGSPRLPPAPPRLRARDTRGTRTREGRGGMEGTFQIGWDDVTGLRETAAETGQAETGGQGKVKVVRMRMTAGDDREPEQSRAVIGLRLGVCFHLCRRRRLGASRTKQCKKEDGNACTTAHPSPPFRACLLSRLACHCHGMVSYPACLCFAPLPPPLRAHSCCGSSPRF